MTYWYLGCLDLGKFGFYAIFRVQKDVEKYIFIRFEDNNSFSRDELLDEHRVLRPRFEDEMTSKMSIEYVTMDRAIQGSVLDAIKNVKSDSDKEELSFYIARRIHLADPRF